MHNLFYCQWIWMLYRPTPVVGFYNGKDTNYFYFVRNISLNLRILHVFRGLNPAFEMWCEIAGEKITICFVETKKIFIFAAGIRVYGTFK